MASRFDLIAEARTIAEHVDAFDWTRALRKELKKQKRALRRMVDDGRETSYEAFCMRLCDNLWRRVRTEKTSPWTGQLVKVQESFPAKGDRDVLNERLEKALLIVRDTASSGIEALRFLAEPPIPRPIAKPAPKEAPKTVPEPTPKAVIAPALDPGPEANPISGVVSAPELAQEPATKPAPEPAPDSAPEVAAEVALGATPRRRGRPRKSQAKEGVPESALEPTPRRRGRPRKSEIIGTSVLEPASTSTPKRRGRPRKSGVEESVLHSVLIPTPKRRGRPRKSEIREASVLESGLAPTPKRRGRPRKSQVREELIVALGPLQRPATPPFTPDTSIIRLTSSIYDEIDVEMEDSVMPDAAGTPVAMNEDEDMMSVADAPRSERKGTPGRRRSLHIPGKPGRPRKVPALPRRMTTRGMTAKRLARRRRLFAPKIHYTRSRTRAIEEVHRINDQLATTIAEEEETSLGHQIAANIVEEEETSLGNQIATNIAQEEETSLGAQIATMIAEEEETSLVFQVACDVAKEEESSLSAQISEDIQKDC